MNQDENTYYDPISEKMGQELLTLLVSHKTPLKIYLRDLFVEGYISPTIDTRYFTFIKTSEAELDSNAVRHTELKCHFTHKNEMFAFKTNGQVVGQNVHLSIPKAFNKVQRRENFRVYVNSRTPQSVELLEAPQFKTQLKNISLSGCQLAVKIQLEDAQRLFQIDSILKIKVQLFEYIKDFECKIKYVDKSDKEDITILGLQLEEMTSEKTEELQAVIFKLDRFVRQISV
jgi:c-di-GMP-binding flagellar brake protein YcgR